MRFSRLLANSEAFGNIDDESEVDLDDTSVGGSRVRLEVRRVATDPHLARASKFGRCANHLSRLRGKRIARTVLCAFHARSRVAFSDVALTLVLVARVVYYLRSVKDCEYISLDSP